MKNNPNKTSSYIIATLLVITFSFGSLWVGTNGIKYASIGEHAPFTNITNEDKTAGVLNYLFPKKYPKLSIIIGGDVMLDRGVRKIAQNSGYDSLFGEISPLFKEADIVAVNLEGPVTSNKSRTLFANGKTSKELIFTFATSTARILKDVGISVVSLANNHTSNFGSKGLEETKMWLNDAEVKWFGSPYNSTSTEMIINMNDIDVAFVGYHAFAPGFDNTLNTIWELSSKGNFVIVMPHWGEEYATTSSEKMHMQAKQLIDAGANAIFGAHPHVIMDKEWIGNVPVFYSLGNLLFDQYFSPDVMRGNIIQMDLNKDSKGIRIENIRVYNTSTASKQRITLDEKFDEFNKR